MKLRLFILCILVALAGSVSGQHLTMKNYQKKALPQKLIMVGNWLYRDSGLYCDSEPITNQDWREYLYWLERIYGKESEQYRAAMPDKAVIYQQLPNSVASYYLTNPLLKDFAVLGVSPEQARAYCQWRTDRVAEQILLHLKILPKDYPIASFSLAEYDNPKKLQFLYFFLPQEGMETRYGFFCFAEWR